MIHARVQDKQLVFPSKFAEIKFYELTEGKDIIITIDDAPTSEMRRFFEGAIVPAVFYQHPYSGWENFKDAREALKLEFLPRWIKVPNFARFATLTKSKGEKRVKVPRSTTELGKSNFKKFLDLVLRWMMENELETPDPEDYKRWRDSAPPRWEIYPPVLRMKTRYDELKNAQHTSPKRSHKPRKSVAARNPKRKGHAK